MTRTQAGIVIISGCVTLLAIAATRPADIHGIVMESVIGVSAQCKDGMYTTSTANRGTCSGHGGVEQWVMEGDR